MSRWLITIRNDLDRERATKWVNAAPPGMRIEFKKAKRTLDQNDMFWGLLTDLSTQLRWHGQKLSPDDWKLVILDGLNREMRIVPNIGGNGFVNLGQSSSDLTKAEMTDAIEIIYALGAQHGVTFSYGEAA